jgi:hypothetical protein
METKNQYQSNLGLIILSISIIIGCLILTGNKVTYKHEQASPFDESRIKLTGEIGGIGIPLSINTNSNDVTYYSVLEIGEGENLIIQLSNGTQEKIEGQNIVVNYYHVSKLLTVEFLSNGKRILKYYNAPIKWGNDI